MIRPIHPGLSPNLETKDFFLALFEILQPWKYVRVDYTKKLENWFAKKYQQDSFAVASGRGALFAILYGLKIGKEDSVLVTGFTCVAVVDAILATGAKPVYVDITKDFVLDIEDLKRKINKTTKAIIIQHTFGIFNINEEILLFAKKNKISLVEDVAHSVGAEHNRKLLGTIGIASFFSFGRDKAFSCVNGGMIVTKDKMLSQNIKEFMGRQQNPSFLWVFQNLFHIVVMYLFILPFYDLFSLGKIFLVIFQKIGLLAKPIDKKELQHFSLYTTKLSSSLSRIALGQLERLEKFNTIRKAHVSLYSSKLHMKNPKAPLLRFPVLVDNPEIVKKVAREGNIYLGDWYSNVIDPKGTNLKKIFYKQGSCPTAEYIAKHIINLPTYSTLNQKDAEKIATLMSVYVAN